VLTNFYKQERNKGDNIKYNDIVRHETLRVAVIGMVENDYYLQIPQPLKDVMEKTFLNFYDSYVATAEENATKNNMQMQVGKYYKISFYTERVFNVTDFEVVSGPFW